MSIRWCAVAVIAVLAVSAPATAHHSFAVHFVGDRTVRVTGTVTEFRFRNPHGVILLNVREDDGTVASWKIETNSPNILRRRGWSPESIAVGDVVTIEGYPARDSSNSMRVYRVEFADGRDALIGQRPAAGIEQ